MDFTFDGGAVREFVVSPNDFVGDITKFYFFLPVYDENTVLSVVSPSGGNCNGIHLLRYNLVLTIGSSSCPYQVSFTGFLQNILVKIYSSVVHVFQTGTWKIHVSGSEAINSFRYTLQAYAETLSTDHDLIISGSYGRKLTAEIFPRMGGLPVYVSVS